MYCETIVDCFSRIDVESVGVYLCLCLDTEASRFFFFQQFEPIGDDSFVSFKNPTYPVSPEW